MGRAETFEHTADLGLRVVASDLPDLFRTAAIALFDVIVANRAEVEEIEQESFDLEAESAEEMLLAWLNELIFRCETGHRLYSNFDVTIEDGGRKLTATIRGEPIDPERHILDHEVKAATRHGLSLRRDHEQWVAEAILDI
jgi:SHS2 domain-containing protein